MLTIAHSCMPHNQKLFLNEIFCSTGVRRRAREIKLSKCFYTVMDKVRRVVWVLQTTYKINENKAPRASNSAKFENKYKDKLQDPCTLQATRIPAISTAPTSIPTYTIPTLQAGLEALGCDPRNTRRLCVHVDNKKRARRPARQGNTSGQFPPGASAPRNASGECLCTHTRFTTDARDKR